MLQMLLHSKEDACVYTLKLMLIKFIGCFVHIDYSLHPFAGLVFIHFEVLVQWYSIRMNAKLIGSMPVLPTWQKLIIIHGEF